MGAYDPVRFSNTAFFYNKGWRGINIEPNLKAHKKFKTQRPRDINVCALVSNQKKPLNLYEFNEPALNTTDNKRASRLDRSTMFKVSGCKTYIPIPLRQILERHLPAGRKIDFLNVDVEGRELDVLKSNNWEKYRPKYLLVEILDSSYYKMQIHPVTLFLAEKGYLIIEKLGRTAVFLEKLNLDPEPQKKNFHLDRNGPYKKKKKILIIVPFFNRERDVGRLAAQLKTQSFKNFETVFIDGGSLDSSILKIRQSLPEANIIFKDNLFWGECLEVGYKYFFAKQDGYFSHVLILNEDTRFARNFLAEGIKAMHKTGADLLGSRSFDVKTGKLIDAGVYWDWNNITCRSARQFEEINCLSTRGLLIRVSVFRALGSFRPWLFPHYLSDYAYTMRAFRKGFSLKTSPRFHLKHEETSPVKPKIEKLVDRLRHIFSIHNKSNPIYYFIFIWTSYPNIKLKIKASRWLLRSLRKQIAGNARFFT